MRKSTIIILLMILGVAIVAVAVSPLGRYAGWAWRRVMGGPTVEERLTQYGPAARNRLKPHFQDAALAYPPDKLVLIGIKDAKVLEVWASEAEGSFARVRTYPILAASGLLGPKLREGDRQVPEGLYQIESLHPNSIFHLALRVNYPNEFDRGQGHKDGRTTLGSDIMIHGSNSSVGCLAMGDEAAEELFVLVADTGLKNTQLILTPIDFRISEMSTDAPDLPSWTDELYAQIRAALEQVSPAEVNTRQRVPSQ